jgi:hypothetical protein
MTNKNTFKRFRPELPSLTIDKIKTFFAFKNWVKNFYHILLIRLSRFLV